MAIDEWAVWISIMEFDFPKIDVPKEHGFVRS